MQSHMRGMRHVAAIHHESHPQHAVFRGYHRTDRHERIFDKVEAKEMLTPAESAYVLLDDNKRHATRLAAFRGELPEKISTLVLICADARMGGMFEFDDFAKRGIAVVYVAGNVADLLDTAGIKEVLKRMDQDSSIIIMGHAKCGAVHCAADKSHYALHRNIAKLLRSVDPASELDNLKVQAAALSANKNFKALAAKQNIHIVTAFVDIAAESPHIELVSSEKAVAKDRELIRTLDARFRTSNKKQDLSAHQFAHAIIISGPSLPFDAREIVSAETANKVFCVSAGDFGGNKHKGHLSEAEIATVEMASLGLLDDVSVASVEYSVENTGTRHIVLLHTDLKVIDAWEKELLQKSDIVTQAVLEGRLEITAAIYDSSTGLITMVRHLVNEDASGMAAKA